MLKKIYWNKRKLAAIIQMGLLTGHHNAAEGRYLVSLKDLKEVLEYRNESMRRRMVDTDELNK